MNTTIGRYWCLTTPGDRRGYNLYLRHYSAKKKHRKTRQFCAPGEKLVLIGFMEPAVWAWQKEKFRKDGQVGVNCAVFRNEGSVRSSDLIREAMAWAWERWPGERLYTFINPAKIKSANPGYCFKMAGWAACGETKTGLLILEAFHGGRDQLDGVRPAGAEAELLLPGATAR